MDVTGTDYAEDIQPPAFSDLRLDRKSLGAISVSEVWSLVGDIALLLLSTIFAGKNQCPLLAALHTFFFSKQGYVT